LCVKAITQRAFSWQLMTIFCKINAFVWSVEKKTVTLHFVLLAAIKNYQ